VRSSAWRTGISNARGVSVREADGRRDCRCAVRWINTIVLPSSSAPKSGARTPGGLTLRPEVLARELGISSKTLRDWLRSEFRRSAAEHGAPWLLTDQQVNSARLRFAGSRPRVQMPLEGPFIEVHEVPVVARPERVECAVRSLVALPSLLRSAMPPNVAGLYAWWINSASLPIGRPAIPHQHPPGVPQDWSLLYVGIAPRGEGGTRTVAVRFHKDHTGGNIGGSTLRQSLAALLMADLRLRQLPGSGRSRLIHEAPLSEWMNQHLAVTFAVDSRPWEIERQIICALGPPLNIQGGTHPFRLQVLAARELLKEACGLSPRARRRGGMPG
jgi:hypothetical protein